MTTTTDEIEELPRRVRRLIPSAYPWLYEWRDQNGNRWASVKSAFFRTDLIWDGGNASLPTTDGGTT